MKLVKPAAALLSIVLLAGCWDRLELNELSITAATAVDWDEKQQWVVSYQVVIPSAISGAMGNMKGGASQSPIIVYSTHGPTIRGAIQQSTFESPRKLFFSHNRVVVVSAEAARRGLEPLIDSYLRNSESRETVDVLVTEESARSILRQLMQIQTIPGEGIYETLRTENRLFSALPSVNMYELALQLLGSSHNAVIPEILISGTPEVTNNQMMGNTSLPSKLRLGRLAVLKEGKLAGWLSQDEALGVAFLRNKVERTNISAPCKATEPTLETSVRVERADTKITPVRRGDELTLQARIVANGTLLETNCSLDLEESEALRQLESQVRQRIIEVVRSGYSATQQLQADVIGLADRVHRKYPKLWHEVEPDWAARYAQIPLNLQVEFTLKRVGLSTKSFKKQFGQEED
ncbi:Ger(x)C family spore germination protein [Cohnella lubricantis]|uniref:Ger(X)C family spore germination protein n=1 Tax=Cohnella lubricantis TaxID=2163172 RepID=A0A841TC94_9BACL|nr:Ger(x)C family spore germination protein [Cohnella lubricantis]MBB6678632.1 Ger(x)C family spore germination protein [Cohnella lubricantis]MBP2119208.1 spore germination protein KC [Cohnella lubricantis]